MCGIVGMIHTIKTDKQQKINAITQLLYVDALRGIDSTGIFLAGNPDNKKVSILKAAVSAPFFINMPEYKRLLDDIFDFTFIVGHNRQASRGSVMDSNAHPFKENNITLVHNGTVSGMCQLNLEKPESNIIVDSHELCYALSKCDAKKVLETISGDYSIVFHDSNDNTLSFARNKERPMYFGENKQGTITIFASESDMITIVSKRTGIELKNISPTPVNKLIKISINNTKLKTQIIDIEEPKRKYYPSIDNIYNKKFNYNSSDSYYKPRTVLTTPEKEIISKHPYLEGIIQTKIPFTIVGFERYSSNNKENKQPQFIYGSIVGKTNIKNNKVGIRVSGFTEKEFLSINRKRCICQGIVASISLDENSKNVILYLTQSSITQEAQNKKEQTEYIGPNKSVISKKDYDALTKDGCSLCSQDLLDDKKVIWKQEFPLCEDCASDYKEFLIDDAVFIDKNK